MTFISAGTRVREFDFSDYAPALGLATLCILGGASKGKVNVPTRIANEAELIRAFGKPLLTDYGLQAAIQYLKQGSRLLYSRVANGALAADYPFAGVSGGSAATKATGTIAFNSSLNPADGDTVTLRKNIPSLTLENDSNGASGNVTVTKVGTNISVTGMSGGDATHRATGTVTLTAGINPADGDTVVIGDGAQTVTFEFDSNSSVVQNANLRQVVIGADAYATLSALITAINSAPSLNVSATTAVVTKTFEFDSNASFTAGRVGVLIGASAAATLLNLISAINGQAALGFTAVNGTVTVPQVNLTNNNAGLVGNSPVAKVGTNITVTGMSGALDAVAGSAVTIMGLEAFSEGTWGNSIQVKVQASTVIGAPAGNFDLLVYYPVDDSGTLALVERFNNLAISSTSDRFVETVLDQGVRGEVSPSQYLIADVLVASGSPAAGTFTLGVAPGNAGTDGISGLVDADYIGTVSGQIPTGLKAVANAETVEFNIIAIPGNSNTDVIDALIGLAEGRGDCIALIDPPFGLSRDEVVDWHNGLGSAIPNSPTQPLTSSYAAMYWGWVKEFDTYNKKSLFMPPSGFIAAVYAYTDNVAGPWFAPAGFVRGHIAGDAVEASPDQADRDVLVGNQNRVNPIVSFINDGLTVFGNRTLQRRPTALDSVHVRRMLLHAEKLCAAATQKLLFEPNDPITWERFTSLVNPILAYIKANRGLEEFKVICDSSTNPPVQRQNKTMKAKLLLKAIDAAEIIELDFALFATGAEFNTAF